MNDIEKQFNKFLNSGKKIDEISFEKLESWVKKGSVTSFVETEKNHGTFSLNINSEIDIYLASNELTLKTKTKKKTYCGLDVQRLYKEIYSKQLKEEEKINSLYSENC